MSTRSLAGFALALAFVATQSCAVADGPGTGGPATYDAPPAPAQSVARMGLAPAYRGFYDALEGEGEWVLIEPYGWVFRPRVNFDSWRPYQQGWWEPSDVYGWVWNSLDSFGWVTDHYGSWFYDSYQGWVWQPGPVWGPAWVAWVGVGDYVGWAPLGPTAYDSYASVPSGMFTFAAARSFGGMQEGSHSSYFVRPPVDDARVSEISNFDRRNGITFNRGPAFDELRRLGGPVAPPVEEPDYRQVKLPQLQPPGESDLLQRTKRLVAVGVRDLTRGRVGAGDAVEPAPRVSPAAPPPATPADSTVTPGAPRKTGHPAPPRPKADPPRPRGGERDSTKH